KNKPYVARFTFRQSAVSLSARYDLTKTDCLRGADVARKRRFRISSDTAAAISGRRLSLHQRLRAVGSAADNAGGIQYCRLSCPAPRPESSSYRLWRQIAGPLETRLRALAISGRF